MSKRFYGDKKIEAVEEQGDFVVLMLDKEAVRLPKKLYEASASKDPLNPTELWDRQCTPIAKETLELWLGWDIKLEQLDYLINMLKTSIEHTLLQANNRLWGKKTTERRLSDVDSVLKKNGEGK